ncbi:LIM domain-containing protein HDR3-like [Carex rostrata]
MASSSFSPSCIHDTSCSSRRSGLIKRLCKLLRGRNHAESGGRRLPRLVCKENMLWQEPNKSRDDQSKADNEELDRAIALSLAEENKHPKGKYFLHSS